MLNNSLKINISIIMLILSPYTHLKAMQRNAFKMPIITALIKCGPRACKQKHTKKTWQKIDKSKILTEGITAGSLASIFSNTIGKKISSQTIRNISSSAVGIAIEHLISSRKHNLPSWALGAKKWNNHEHHTKSIVTSCTAVVVAVCTHIYSQYKENQKRTQQINQTKPILNNFKSLKKDIDQNNDICTPTQLKTILTGAKATYQKEYSNHGNLYKNIIQKLTVNEKTDIAVHADLHGDAKSLYSTIESLQKKGYMNGWKIKKDNFYLIFLGDYTDRGKQNIETFSSVLKLKIENPEKVVLIRGNHEDTIMNSREAYNNKLYELGKKENLLSEIDEIYSLLPEALFFGYKNKNKTNWLLFCHGGHNNDHNCLNFLKSHKKYDYIINTEKDQPFYHWPYSLFKKIYNGSSYMMWYARTWNSQPKYRWNYYYGYDHNYNDPENHKKIEKNINTYFEKNSNKSNHLKAIIRGHEHYNNLLKKMIKSNGIAKLSSQKNNNDNNNNNKLNKSLLYTLNKSPITENQPNYKKKRNFYQFDTYALININGDYKNWTIDPVNEIIDNNPKEKSNSK